jgi:hypothetical protein
MPRNRGGQTKGRLLPSITETVSTAPIHAEALDRNWGILYSQDFESRELAEAYVAREYTSAREVHEAFGLTYAGMVMPVFLIDGDQYVPAAFTVTPIGTKYILRARDRICAFRLTAEHLLVVGNRQPLTAGTVYPSEQSLADALSAVTA